MAEKILSRQSVRLALHPVTRDQASDPVEVDLVEVDPAEVDLVEVARVVAVAVRLPIARYVQRRLPIRYT
jgi:hypothetical protein